MAEFFDHKGHPVKHGRARVNGIRMHYVTAGQGGTVAPFALNTENQLLLVSIPDGFLRCNALKQLMMEKDVRRSNR